MSLFHKNTLLGASGAGGAAEALYVDDVFSTFLYEGNGSTQTITNGIDLDGEGGLVWIKQRSLANTHRLFDTLRGVGITLSTALSSGNTTRSASLTAFNSDGFDLGSDSTTNGSGQTHASWTFRKAPGFFDIVTYTGNGSSTGDSQTISHNLGSTPGFVIIKRTSGTGDWICWHRSISTGQPRKYLELDATNGTGTMGADIWGTVSSTEFEVKHNGTVGDSYEINKSGETYVAYFFAHDDQSFGTDSDEAIVECGSYTGSGSAGKFVNVGFEPQWVLIKCTSEARDWVIRDNMRSGQEIYPNLTDADKNEPYFDFSANGFTLQDSSARHNKLSATYVYVAIRRPHKPPTAGTDVFNAVADAGSTSARTITAGNLVDLQISKSRNNTYTWYWLDRLRGAVYLTSAGTNAESSSQVSSTTFDVMDGISVGAADGFTYSSPFGGPYIRYFLTRAPGFFDVVTYSGNSTAGRTVSHNLGVKPELMIVKARSGATNQLWFVYNSNDTATDYLNLNTDDAATAASNVWNNTEPTSSVFTVGLSTFTNASNYEYVAYLFATLAGISKVGTYSGTGSDVDVDCGFSAGARFVLIKRTDDTGDWYVWDSQRGIATGNDPYMRVNLNNTETTSTDYIDPLNSGFTVTSSAPAALNASGGTYIFLAIA